MVTASLNCYFSVTSLQFYLCTLRATSWVLRVCLAGNGTPMLTMDFNMAGVFSSRLLSYRKQLVGEFDMRHLHRMIFKRFFRELDQPIVMLREMRDSYRAMNVEIYGERMASLLNDW